MIINSPLDAPPGTFPAALLVLEDAQLRRPVRERLAQALDVPIAGEQFGFDGRNLPAAANDSCGLLPALLRDLVESPAVSLQHRLLARVFLISPDDTISVSRIDFHQPRFPVAPLAGDQG